MKQMHRNACLLLAFQIAKHNDAYRGSFIHGEIGMNILHASIAITLALLSIPQLRITRALDFLLQLQYAVEECLGGGWASRHVDVDRDLRAKSELES